VLGACSFDYDSAAGEGEDLTLVLRKTEYVRISGGNPEVRLQAEEIRRYEKTHAMELDALSFEQFNAAPEGYEEIPGINARGQAGFARLETDTHNFSMEGNIFIEVNSEDITIKTGALSWEDAGRILTIPGELQITRSDGTSLAGSGFSADIRRRTWEFKSPVEGTVVDNEDTGEEDKIAGEGETAADEEGPADTEGAG
jgi:hypothetical protein